MPSALVAIGLNLLVAVMSPNGIALTVRLLACALGVAFLPYSGSLHPTKDRLRALDQGGALRDKSDESEEAAEARKLVERWRILQAYRTGLCGFIWSLCVRSEVGDEHEVTKHPHPPKSG